VSRRFVLILVLLVLAACGQPEPVVAPSPPPDPEVPTPPPVDEPLPDPDPTPEPTPGPVAPAEVRGVWVHLFDDTLKTRAGIDAMLARIDAAGVNTVIAEVVRRQDAYYASTVLPPTADPTLEPGLDILEHLITGAHERGIAVHAWFPGVQTYHPVYDDLPRPHGWIWTDRGPEAAEADRWVTRSHDGSWGEYLDLGVPAVQELMAATAAELAARYRIDAVHLDYFRYDGSQWGYHPEALARFQHDTGRRDIPDPADAQWSDWRREQTRAAVALAREAVAAANPEVGISAAVIAQGEGPRAGRPFEATVAYREKLQDWAGWARDGLVDAVFPMMYFRDGQHGAWWDQWAAFTAELAATTDVVVAPGQGSWLNPVQASLRQLEDAVATTDGAVVYSYQQNADTEPYHALLDALGSGPWAEPAPPPRLGRE
jgi:uncharacterized lipoprotein YddW (UPF0748 family)